VRKKSRGRKEKKKGGCLKYFLYLFFAIVIFGAFSGSGDRGNSSKEETEPSVNAEASASASSLADSSGFSSSTNNKKVADEPQEEQAPNRKEESVQNQFIVYFIDIGQGDASLILCDDSSMLIDGGQSKQSDKIYAFLKEKGIDHLDYIVATHPDDDHVGGLAGALNYATVDTAFSPVSANDSISFENFKKYLDKQGVEITVPAAGDTFPLGDSTVTVLGPKKVTDSDNNNSIVLKVTHGENSFLFTGDAEREEENDIIDAGADLESTVLKIAHHGSASSTSDEWLNAVNPAAAIISCGMDNEYGHPTAEVLDRLKTRGIQTFRTDLQGNITIYEQDGKLVYETGKNPDADVFVAGVIPVEDPETPSPRELEAGDEKAVSEDQPITRGGGTESAPEKHEMDYIVNVKTGKFHYPDCRGVRQMKESNKRYVTCDRQELLDQGYESCGICFP